MKKGIEVKELTMRFGNITALDRVDLILEENRIYGLLGRNGAGKSTLLNVIGNRLYPSEGAVVIDGEIGMDNGRAAGKSILYGRKKYLSGGNHCKAAVSME